MPTKVKIKINDNTELRSQLDAIYENKSQVEMAQWAIKLAKHILEFVNYDYDNCEAIQDGFITNERWQRGEARMHDVRQAGFKIHKIAKECPDLVIQVALRVTGQAVGTGHMKEHAMVASDYAIDYAIKVVNLMLPEDMEAVTRERNWQLGALK
ncbi:putative immunity protein [Desulfitobacterium sp.]|uniref:putative immunity protein n=1 Tax=Desulfitobacterium sp. TaxID=49981 RepID=UPI002B219BF5|nr:hypothetical protein [Desulfitobacterium sp.]MEA4903137.1 hypothetical protein [Desulfitobacterium sp.]